MVKRLFSKCLIRPEDLVPSREDLEIIGVFNPGVSEVDGKIVLLARVAERPRERRNGWIGLPRWADAFDLTFSFSDF